MLRPLRNSKRQRVIVHIRIREPGPPPPCASASHNSSAQAEYIMRGFPLARFVQPADRPSASAVHCSAWQRQAEAPTARRRQGRVTDLNLLTHIPSARCNKQLLRPSRHRNGGSCSARASSAESAGTDAAMEAGLSVPASSSVDCIGSSMDVTCSVSDDSRDPQSMPLAKAEASVGGVAADGDGLAESLGAKVLAVLLLVSPFFFWGTSMVGMKVRYHPNGQASRLRCCLLQA